MNTKRSERRQHHQNLALVSLPASDGQSGENDDERTRASTEEDRQEFFIPVHGFVWFYPEEVQVINHPAFQRLEGLHQLGSANLIYRGASHRRIEHALGTVAVVKKILDAVRHNCKKDRKIRPEDGWQIGSEPTPLEERFARLAALLHDIGHVPFGHTFEDELGRIGKHDEESRLNLILDEQDWFGVQVPSLSEVVNDAYVRYLKDLPIADMTACEIVKLIIVHRSKDENHEPVSEALLDRLAAAGLRINVCRNIVGNTICADLLDYLFRDWYHIGKLRFMDDRIFQYMEIRSPMDIRSQKENQSLSVETPAPHRNDQFVINIGHQDDYSSDGISSILELLESRYQLAEAVIFHKTKMKLTAMLERLLALTFDATDNGDATWPGDPDLTLERWLIANPEDALLPAIRSLAAKELADPESERSDRVKWQAVHRLASQLQRRELYQELTSANYLDLSGRRLDDIQETFGDCQQAAQNRATALAWFEEDFGLPPGTVVMYCPQSEMNRKVAEVQLYVDGTVMTFVNFESRHKNKLSSGHLLAQTERFQDLWRIVFCIDSERLKDLQLDNPKFIRLLDDAIMILLLGQKSRRKTLEEAVAELAERALRFPDFYWTRCGVQRLSEMREARVARTGEAVSLQPYPLKAPRLLQWMSEPEHEPTDLRGS